MVEVHKASHDQLAIHSVTHASMAWNHICEVLNQKTSYLDLDRSLQAWSEEATERTDDACEERKQHEVSLQLGDIERPKANRIEHCSLAAGQSKGNKVQFSAWASDSRNALQCRSQLNHLTSTTIENKQVLTAPPIYPSQVFLGERAISWCFPKKYPKMYAKISLMTMTIDGSTK